MQFTDKEKQELINNSKTFCMMPWVSIHSSPRGIAIPCCIAHQSHNIGDVNQSSMMELVNSPGMNQLRRDMVDGVKNLMCGTCYSHEEHGIKSLRQTANEEFQKYFDESMVYTDRTGELGLFKMRYFDLRLNNICNMKCRTCNSSYSSQWENEDAKQGIRIDTVRKDQRKKYMEDILQHIPYMDIAYFAGGEPMITEEHYIMLEEMIRLGRTDIQLRYNTNMSNLKYKNKDLLDLWSRFSQKIDVSASIDDFGKRAEYIRSGTVWEEVEENFRKLRSLPYVHTSINSVLSIFNFVTLNEFYNYLIDNNLYTPEDRVYTIYNMVGPPQYAALALPMHLKTFGLENLNQIISRMENMGFSELHLTQLINAKKWVMKDHTWGIYKDRFQKDTVRLDSLRSEKFSEVFPHLSELMK